MHARQLRLRRGEVATLLRELRGQERRQRGEHHEPRLFGQRGGDARVPTGDLQVAASGGVEAGQEVVVPGIDEGHRVQRFSHLRHVPLDERGIAKRHGAIGHHGVQAVVEHVQPGRGRPVEGAPAGPHTSGAIAELERGQGFHVVGRLPHEHAGVQLSRERLSAARELQRGLVASGPRVVVRQREARAEGRFAAPAVPERAELLAQPRQARMFRPAEEHDPEGRDEQSGLHGETVSQGAFDERLGGVDPGIDVPQPPPLQHVAVQHLGERHRLAPNILGLPESIERMGQVGPHEGIPARGSRGARPVAEPRPPRDHIGRHRLEPSKQRALPPGFGESRSDGDDDVFQVLPRLRGEEQARPPLPSRPPCRGACPRDGAARPGPEERGCARRAPAESGGRAGAADTRPRDRGFAPRSIGAGTALPGAGPRSDRRSTRRPCAW